MENYAKEFNKKKSNLFYYNVKHKIILRLCFLGKVVKQILKLR